MNVLCGFEKVVKVARNTLPHADEILFIAIAVIRTYEQHLNENLLRY